MTLVDNSSIDNLEEFIGKYVERYYQGDNWKTEGAFWNEVSRLLTQGIDEGMDMSDYNGITDDLMRANLYNNIAVFVAFKNHSFSAELTKLLVDENGDVRDWSSFKKEALKVSENYNNKWLKTEYDHAVGVGNMAAKWQDFQDRQDLYPNLKYIQIERRTKNPKHVKWNGLVLPIDHPFWKTHYPPNDWGCGCDVEQTDEDVETNGIDVENMPALGKMFNINSALDGIVYDKSHPYFSVGTKSKEGIQIREALEKYKMEFPDYQPASRHVRVSRWADPSGLKRDKEVAVALSEKTESLINIRPYANPMFAKGKKMPEYEINGLLADRKSPTQGNFKELIKSAKDQGCEVIVFDLEKYPYDLASFNRKLNSYFDEPTNHQQIKKIYVVDKDMNVIEYKRKKAE